MSDRLRDDDDAPLANGAVNGHGADQAISDDDVRAMLARETAEKKRLRAELDAERGNRTRAESQAKSAGVARFEAEEAAIGAKLEASEAQALGLRRAYSEALAEGRFDDAAQAQDQMAELRAQQVADKQYRTWLAGEKTRAQQVQTAEPRTQSREAVDLTQYSDKQRRWIRDNPDYLTDQSVREKAFLGHQIAMAHGAAVDSPKYFKFINDAVHGGEASATASRSGQQDPEDDGADGEPPPRRTAAARAFDDATDMPVTRRGQTTPTRQAPMRLSPEQMEAADITNPDIPVQGHHDPQGKWVPGRYEKYFIQMQALKARGGR